MICIGYNNIKKIEVINQYLSQNKITKIYIIYQDRLEYENAEHIPYAETIMYRTFYPLLQKLDGSSLIVLNECLRTQDRNDLTYNCIRHYLDKTKHQIIFQHLPIIDTREDFMVLFDFDTRSRWKRNQFDLNLILDNSDVQVSSVDIQFQQINILTSEKTKEKYELTKAKMFDALGGRDPHTLPRNLHMIGAIYRDKSCTDTYRTYITRNSRLKGALTYNSVTGSIQDPITLVDLPHRFLDFTDFVRACGQSSFDVMTTDLKVDQWYFTRYMEWRDRLKSLYMELRK